MFDSFFYSFCSRRGCGVSVCRGIRRAGHADVYHADVLHGQYWPLMAQVLVDGVDRCSQQALPPPLPCCAARGTAPGMQRARKAPRARKLLFRITTYQLAAGAGFDDCCVAWHLAPHGVCSDCPRAGPSRGSCRRQPNITRTLDAFKCATGLRMRCAPPLSAVLAVLAWPSRCCLVRRLTMTSGNQSPVHARLASATNYRIFTILYIKMFRSNCTFDNTKLG